MSAGSSCPDTGKKDLRQVRMDRLDGYRNAADRLPFRNGPKIVSFRSAVQNGENRAKATASERHACPHLYVLHTITPRIRVRRMERFAEIIAAHAGREGALLPISHDVQAAFGHVPEEAKRAISAASNSSRAEVHGVVSFYHDFHAEADARPVSKSYRA
ncbi:hypothetical protein OY671_010240, partial [Metschnikowia pulcherrima]